MRIGGSVVRGAVGAELLARISVVDGRWFKNLCRYANLRTVRLRSGESLAKQQQTFAMNYMEPRRYSERSSWLLHISPSTWLVLVPMWLPFAIFSLLAGAPWFSRAQAVHYSHASNRHDARCRCAGANRVAALDVTLDHRNFRSLRTALPSNVGRTYQYGLSWCEAGLLLLFGILAKGHC
jgi:hypothetical protein